MSLSLRKERWFYAMISPWLLGLFFFQAIPILAVLYFSFTDLELPAAPIPVGLEQFSAMASDAIFHRTLLNTVYYTAGSVPLGISLGLVLALAVNRRTRYTAFFRAIFFLPVTISGVATVLMWAWIFNPRLGLINQSLSMMGISGPAWLNDMRWAMPAVILMSLWNAGINMVVYLGALQSIPSELYESARLDGAGMSARIWYITLPLLSPATFYLLIVDVVASFQVFTPVYLLTGGGPDNATLTLPLYIYLTAFRYHRFGYGSALSMALFLMVFLLTLAQMRLGRKWVFYRAGTT